MLLLLLGAELSGLEISLRDMNSRSIHRAQSLEYARTVLVTEIKVAPLVNVTENGSLSLFFGVVGVDGDNVVVGVVDVDVVVVDVVVDDDNDNGCCCSVSG